MKGKPLLTPTEVAQITANASTLNKLLTVRNPTPKQIAMMRRAASWLEEFAEKKKHLIGGS